VDLSPPEYSERILFLGETGCGKTTLARAFLNAGYPRYVVIDTKGDFPLTPAMEEVVITSPLDKRWKRPPDRTIFRPSAQHASGPWLSYVLGLCYGRAQREGKRKPFLVYVDEGFFLARQGHTQWLSGLAVSGRSLGVGLWVSSQRPRWIPTEIKSEAHRTYVFHLGYEEDELEMLKVMKMGIGADAKRRGLALIQEATENYAFLEIARDRAKAGHRTIRRCPPITIQ
jgi:energy-coupling factor transporter ATP-binding protein EcfA2